MLVISVKGQGLNDFLPTFAIKQKTTIILGSSVMVGKENRLEENLKFLGVRNVDIIDPIERSELLKNIKMQTFFSCILTIITLSRKFYHPKSLNMQLWVNLYLLEFLVTQLNF